MRTELPSAVFIYDGSYRELLAPGSTETLLSGINATGQATGYATYGDTTLGLIYDGSYRIVAPPGSADFTIGKAINASGQVTGWFCGSLPFDCRGYVYDGIDYATLLPPGALEARLYGISDTGLVVGEYRDDFSNYLPHAFLAAPVAQVPQVPEPSTLVLLVAGLSFFVLLPLRSHRLRALRG